MNVRRFGKPEKREDEAERQLIALLYRQYGQVLMRHAMRLTGNDKYWSEDVVQETLLRAWRHAEKLDRDPDLLRAWLFTVARRIVIDARRSKGIRPQEVDPAPLEVMPEPARTDEALSRIVIKGALDSLSAEHREAVEQTYLRDRSVSEAAAVLGVPPGTVKSRVFYALRALRRNLEEQGVTS
ncbi:sigma-70 family RNA polymerase sigma factor [Crossiella cryophila]|uniref:RNA polymerase sigma factor n=1 Tax=Crossiella cryophila TaxID=43355 RepID=A0A7W7C7R3_9PSEU|nr:MULTISPECIES: sigma-70 family RNA polymerase sigma factor [Crossiella]MBB4676035.1 RNA polymerase sigma-70 factor (ECF subfamily) [Crossiella cryophila]MCK2244081.1 sigma-70 family RNA polymerase sigma factor [Crossiella sp. S99.2]MCK2257061.1 sigma-70 family RNA polymerase sigma factor [Crossiella sp. S99.1]